MERTQQELFLWSGPCTQNEGYVEGQGKGRQMFRFLCFYPQSLMELLESNWKVQESRLYHLKWSEQAKPSHAKTSVLQKFTFQFLPRETLH